LLDDHMKYKICLGTLYENFGCIIG
jgi:hypothetical protein